MSKKPDPSEAPHWKELKPVHSWDERKLVAHFQTDMDKGYANARVVLQRDKYGRNEVPAEAGTPLWLMILRQFQDNLVLILIGAALVGLVLAFFEDNEQERTTAFVEPLVIVLILIANATVGVLQENSAEKAVEALKEYDADVATVLRNGEIVEVPAGDLVPGDVVEVEVGQKVPADIRVLRLYSSSLYCEQAALTGESEPVGKITTAIDNPDAVIQDKKNMLFAGTPCVRGKCRGIVTHTGIHTQKGQIGQELNKTEEKESPLQLKLDQFGDWLSKSIGVICLLVWVINYRHFSDPAFGGLLKGAVYYFKIAVSLAVAAIPEGLPAVVTTCLALGTQRMAKRNAIVTHLPAVETLGCTNVICSDKTGTLTTNQMSVKRFFVLDRAGALAEFEVEGSTYEPFKRTEMAPFAITPTRDALGQAAGKPAAGLIREPSILQLARICGLCNDASIQFKDKEQRFDKVGQATEAAMKVLTEKLGHSGEPLPAGFSMTQKANIYSASLEKKTPKLATLEFTRDRKSMSVVVQEERSQSLLVKGAWDNVLARCTKAFLNGSIVPLDAKLRKAIQDQTLSYCTGAEAYRCLAVAIQENTTVTPNVVKSEPPENFVKYEKDLTFVGVVAIIDPPRDEVPPAIATCRDAGISVIVITGDNIDTAVAICRKIGLFGKDENVKGLAYTGAEFRAMTEKEQLEVVLRARLFARVEPIDKKNLVLLLHKHKKVVAMTGDGVNDAPALQAADIGVGMGSGTAVAKGASKLILQDDNFATVVASVEEGRCIYNNTKQFIRYLICSNIGEVVSIFVTAITGLPEVLLPVQLLWVNLVTDGLPAVALGFNPAEEGIMKLPPRPSDEPIVTPVVLFRFIITGLYIGLATIAGSLWWFMFYSGGPHLTFTHLFDWANCSPSFGVDCAIFEDNSPNTMSLSVLVTIEMFQALNSVSERQSILSRTGNPLSNPTLIGAICLSFLLHFVILYVPFLAHVFNVEPLNMNEWTVVVLLSLPVILLDEIIKFFLRVTLGHGHPKPKSD